MIRKVDGRWALVSRTTGHPLAYWGGSGKPPEWWVKKQERRVHYYSANPLSAVEWVVGGIVAASVGVAAYFMGKSAGGPAKASKSSQASAPKVVTVTNSDADKTIQLNVGDTLDVALSVISMFGAASWQPAQAVGSSLNPSAASSGTTIPPIYSVEQKWMAVSPGTETLSYAVTGSVQQAPIMFTVVVS